MNYTLRLVVACWLGVNVLGVRCAQAQGTPPPPAASPTDQPMLDEETQKALDSGPRGTLAIRGIQGTKGAPPIGVCDVEINLLHRGQLVKRLNVRTDEQGQAVVADLPVGVAVRPLVRIKYDNVLYQDSADQLDPSRPATKLDIYCYKTTDAPTPWKIVSRQIALAPEGGSVTAVDTVTVENPTDKTWIGGPPGPEYPADSKDRRTVAVFTLPEGASDVTLGSGFHGWCCTAFAARTLTVQMPLMPGRAAYKLKYRVPIAPGGGGQGGSRGTASFIVASPAPTDELIISVPNDRSPVEPRSMTAVGTQAVDGRAVRLYRGEKLDAGAEAGLVITTSGPGDDNATTATLRPAREQGGASSPGETPLSRNLLIGGVGVGVIGVGAFAFYRANRRARAFQKDRGAP